MSLNKSLIGGAAGKTNSNSGDGDYFSLGDHKAQIVKHEVAESKKAPGTMVQAVEGSIVVGGQGKLLHAVVDGKVVKNDPVQWQNAPEKGRKQAWVNKSTPDTLRFQKNLGEFSLAAKKTFLNVISQLEKDEDKEAVTKYLDGRGLNNDRVKAFIARGKENAVETSEEDIYDIIELPLCIGMVMSVSVRQHVKVDKTLTTVLSWGEGSFEDQLLLNDE